MRIGVSSACFYPLLTEEAVKLLCDNQVKNMEIFLNCPSELDYKFIRNIKNIIDSYGVSISSIHPFTSGFEGYLFFTTYDRRYNDGLAMYQSYFEVCHQLDCEVVVFHGGNKDIPMEKEFYFEQYGKLYEFGRKNDVKIAHENVCRSKSGSLEFVRQMKKYLEDNISFVFDVKQAVRANENVYEFVKVMGDKIENIHMSDNNSSYDCLPIGEGTFCMSKFASTLAEVGYDKFVTLELYRHNFNDINDIVRSVKKLEEIF